MHNALILTKHIASTLVRSFYGFAKYALKRDLNTFTVIRDLQVQKFVDDDLPLEILTFLGRNLEPRRYQLHVCTIK